tara:strand:+ start:1086 stop:1700 length:615 start_codon:yes stop_codon:yes gene_type:complete
MFCKQCGNRLEAGALFCSSCGMKIEKEQQGKVPQSGQSRLNKDRVASDSFDKGVTELDEIYFSFESPIQLCLLQLVTFGIYYYFLLHRWIKAINSASKKDLCDPALAIVLSIITLGAAAIYFDYQIVDRAEKLAKSTNGNSNPKRRNISPPIDNLKELVLIGGIFIFIIQFVFPLVGFAAIALNLLIHKSLEYTFYTQNQTSPN